MTPSPSPGDSNSLAAASGAAAGEQVWMDVIQKMDEVYHELLDYEVALEEKNSALEESQQFISSVLASISDVLVVCDRAGVIEEVNPSMQKLTGKDEGALRGCTVFELFADEASRQRAQHHFTDEAGLPMQDAEMNLRAFDGSAVPVSLNCTPRYSAVGKLQGQVITGRPIGELQRAYKALRQAHDDLKRTQQQLLHAEKMASLGRLVAGVAHELNNPISFVLGNVVALKRYSERLRTYCERIHAGASSEERETLRRELRIDRIVEDLPSLIEGTVEGSERTRDIVDGLKRFSAMDRNLNEQFDLIPIVQRAVHWVSNGAPANFKAEVQLPESVLITGSAGQLQQVVMNLVQNAVDATANADKPHLLIAGGINDEAVHIDFHDNGPGIPAENLSRIFDPFFTTKPVGKGTGLGLAISYGIVGHHGGSLRAFNAPSGGAVFSLVLPLAGKATLATRSKAV